MANDSPNGNRTMSDNFQFINLIGISDNDTTRDALAILEECERGEDSAVKAYQEALATEMGEAHVVVAQQATEVQAAHDKVRSLRDSFKKVNN